MTCIQLVYACVCVCVYSCCEKEVHGLKEQADMFQESIAAKDNIVISLTNRLAETEKLLGSHDAAAMATQHSSTNTTMTLLGDVKEAEKLKVSGCSCT